MGVFIFNSGGGGNSGPALDWDQVNVEPQFVLQGKKFLDKDKQLKVGTILNWDGTVLSGASGDSNKIIVAPATTAKHIAAGRYLSRDIEIAAMEAGSAAMERNGNVITLHKTSGYITGGDVTETVPLYNDTTSITPGTSTKYFETNGKYLNSRLSVVGSSNLIAANIKKNVTIFGVTGTLQEGTTYDTYNGATTITPGTSAQYFYTAGKYVASNLTVYGSSNLKSSNIKSGVSIFGITGTYTGGGTISGVYTGSGTVTNNSSTLVITCPSGYILAMAGFMAENISYSNKSKTVGGYARSGSSTGRGSYVTSDGNPAVGSLTASFSDNSVTITPLSGYSFSGITYKALVCYYKES